MPNPSDDLLSRPSAPGVEFGGVEYPARYRMVQERDNVDQQSKFFFYYLDWRATCAAVAAYRKMPHFVAVWPEYLHPDEGWSGVTGQASRDSLPDLDSDLRVPDPLAMDADA